MRLALAIAVIAACAAYAPGQSKIDVTATPIEKQVGPAGSQAVRYLEGARWLTVQSQGGRAAQLDMSIQGSTFSGAGLAINGISLQHAQTEHFNADLPLAAGILGPPSTLSGFDQIAASSGHLIGTLDMTPLVTPHIGTIEAGAGTYDTLFFHMIVPFGTDEKNSAVFFSREETDELSFDDNDMKNTRGGFSLNFAPAGIDLNILAGAASKEFGARGFYGVNPDWNAREVFDDYLLAASASSDGEPNSWRASAAYRRTRDEYTIFWDMPGTYSNSHETDMAAVNVNGRCALMPGLGLEWRASGTADRIDSSNLGNYSREHGSVLAAPSIEAGKATLQAGVNQLLYSDEKNKTLPVIYASFSPDKNTSVFTSYTETQRLPSYTELNYESPGSLGNSGLQPESSRNMEAGVRIRGKNRGPAFRVTAFMHDTENTIDWIKTDSSSPRWIASDLGDVRTAGLQCDMSAEWTFLNLYLAYIYLDRKFDEDFYGGRYVINYAEHAARVNIELKPSSGISLFLNHDLRLQHEASFRDELDNSQVMGDIGVSLALPWFESARINMICENLWDDDFEIFPGQPPASRRYTVSVQWYWQ